MLGSRRRAELKAVPRAARTRSAASIAPSAERVLQRIEWTVLRRLDGLLHGNYRTLFRGFGIDLADLREYQISDDARTIDWNATARLQQPYVRQFNEERDVTAWFLVDLSGSIDFGGQSTKRARALEFVALLARLLTRHGNRVGAVLYTDRVEVVLPARGGRLHVLHLIDRMLKSAPSKTGKLTRLGELLQRALRSVKRRSVVFVVSDFISCPGWSRELLLLGQRHEVIAVRLYDPLEMVLPDLGQVIVEDSETGQQLFVDTHDAAFRKRFARRAAEREAALRAALADAGADCLELSTTDDLVDTLLNFTRLRKRRAQLASGAAPQGVGP